MWPRCTGQQIRKASIHNQKCKSCRNVSYRERCPDAAQIRDHDEQPQTCPHNRGHLCSFKANDPQNGISALFSTKRERIALISDQSCFPCHWRKTATVASSVVGNKWPLLTQATLRGAALPARRACPSEARSG